MPMDGYALCLGTEASFAGAGVIFSCQCQERQHGQSNMWHKFAKNPVSHLLHISICCTSVSDYCMCAVAW